MPRLSLLFFACLALGCESQPALGSPCARASECASPLVCRLGRCRAECREQRDCPALALCVRDAEGNGSCALVDDPDCRVSGCTGDLACVGSVCVNLCSSIAECPAGSACVPTPDGRARCARADGEDAGAPNDASQDDATSDGGASCTPGADCDPILQMAAGDGFTCARTASGELWCWGAVDVIARGPSPSGCVGNSCFRPARAQIEHPSGDVHDATGVTWVSAREYGGCMVTAGEPVTCWANTPFSAALGSDSDGAYARPVLRVTSGPLLDATEAHVMVQTALAVGSSGAWSGWGDDSRGQFGSAPTGDHARATDIDPPLVGSTYARFGNAHGCAILGGEVWCWGANDRGQAGDLAHVGAGANVLGATQVAGVNDAIALVLGDLHSCALLSTGEIRCWGDRASIGNDAPTGCVLASTMPDEYGCPPTTVARGGGLFRALADQGHAAISCAIDVDGDLWCWGADWNGSSDVPVRTELERPVTAAVATWSHVCAVANGVVYCWGVNDYGQLGRITADTTDRNPGPVAW